MVGFIFKYQAIPAGDLRDIGGIPDPNFWLEKVEATWAICGPYRRQALSRKGRGTVFFVPYAYARKKLRLAPVCTGVLVVGRIIPDSTTLIKSREFPTAYKRLYKEDLEAHLKRDPPRTKKIRGKHIIVGSSKSHWLGKRYVNLVPLLKRLKISDVASTIDHNRAVRTLTDSETERLYEAVIKKWRKTKAIRTPPIKAGDDHWRACAVCF